MCGKFNQTDCCLKIEDNGKAMTVIATDIRKIAHVPVQSWKEWDPSNLFGGWFSTFGSFNTLVGIVLFLRTSLLLPSLLPLFIWSTTSFTEAIVETKTATKVLMLWRYRL